MIATNSHIFDLLEVFSRCTNRSSGLQKVFIIIFDCYLKREKEDN